MIDTHIHIIPEVDDGSTDLSMSIEMLKIAKAQGIDEIITTSHYYIPAFMNDKIAEQFEKFKKEALKQKIDVKLYLGNEMHLNEETIGALKEGKVRTLGDSDYLLIELSDYHYYNFHEMMLFDLRVEGYNVLLAHVERCRAFNKDFTILETLVEHGFYGQLSANYIVDRKTRKKALLWIQKGVIHVVASDAHNLKRRPNNLRKAYEVVEVNLGQECADTLFTDNPKKIIDNKELMSPIISKSIRNYIRNFMK